MRNLTCGVFAIVVLLGISGCTILRQSELSALQGNWSGREIGSTPETPRHLVFSGSRFEYRGADAKDWAKGTFTLRVESEPKQLLVTLSECGLPEYIGKTCRMIYKIEDGALTATANEPGDAPAPRSFDEPGARQMVFKKE